MCSKRQVQETQAATKEIPIRYQEKVFNKGVNEHFGTSGTEKLWNLLWRCSEMDWNMVLHSLGSWLCFEWGFGAGGLQRSLAIQIIQ